MIPELYLNIVIFSTFNILFGLYSHFIKESLFLSESLVSMAFGILFGPVGFNLIFPAHHFTSNSDLWLLFYHFARFIMTFQTMAVGISLPKKKKDLFVLLCPVMLSMWLISTLIIFSVLKGSITFLEAVALAACVTPTDPVLASSIIKGRFAEEHIPERVRNLLSAESGANDGIAFPLLQLPIVIMRFGFSGLLIHWVLKIWIQKVFLALPVGIAIGLISKKLLKYSQYHDLIDKQSFLVFSLALSLFIMAVAHLIGINDMLAIFTAGAVFAWDDWFTDQTSELSEIQAVIDSIFNSTFFVMFGASIPWKSFEEIGIIRLILISLLILVLRRLPAVMLFGPLREKREKLFSGWFGPIGVGSIFYSIALTMQLHYKTNIFLPIICFIVMTSVLAHGITVPLFHLTMTRHLTLDTIRIDFWKTIDLILPNSPENDDNNKTNEEIMSSLFTD